MQTKVKVKFIRSTIADGKDFSAGTVAEISEHDARLLIRMGKALPCSEPEKIESRDPEPENRDPQPMPKKGKKE